MAPFAFVWVWPWVVEVELHFSFQAFSLVALMAFVLFFLIAHWGFGIFEKEAILAHLLSRLNHGSLCTMHVLELVYFEDEQTHNSPGIHSTKVTTLFV